MRSRTGSRRLVGLGLAVLLVFALTACGDDDDDVAVTTTAASGGDTTTTEADAAAEWEQVVTDAEAEGTVLLYTVTQEAVIATLEPAFEQAYPGIDFQYFRGNTGEVITRLETERQAGGDTADVVIVNLDSEPSTMQTYDDDGLVETPIGPTFEEEDVQATLVDNLFYVYASVFGWGWNTQLLPNGIEDWEDFLSPELSGGKIAVFDPTQSSIIPSCYEGQINASTPTFLEDLAGQEPKIYPGSQAMEAAVAAGEVAITAFSSKRILDLKAQGAPVDYVVPEEGACVPTLEGAVLKAAPHPNAAQVFADWIMSEEAQSILNQSVTPARSNVPGATVDFADLEPTAPASPEEHQAFIAEFDRLFR
jgi:iron(III) transport system substrate-binding protein